MYTLSIDTTAAACSIALHQDEKCIDCFEQSMDFGQAEVLMPEIDNILKKHNLTIKDLSLLVVCVGPGSFTGIRIGLATVKGLLFGKEIPVKPITSFDTIAYNTKENKILCVIDALHDNFYTQKYVDGKRKGEPEFLPLNKVLELQNEYKIYSFEPLTKLNSTVVSLFDGFRLASEDEGNLITAKELYPLYVRKSQAE